MKTATKAGLTCAAADAGVTLATNIRHINTKLISMSEMHTYMHTHSYKVCAQSSNTKMPTCTQ